MKTEIKFTFDDEDGASRQEVRLATKAILHAEINQAKIDELYDEVFRPVIKYGEDEAQLKFYEEVWEKVSEHFNLGDWHD